ncbi:MAG TPA: tRNA lysidine(34) synthetase TilS [Rhodocyclaceae bacterium]|nr:tRNA lysidine(34) synthetase TilS [Rhodocyclaceae bacterium]
MAALIETFKKSIDALHPSGGPVLAAVSGGADSMALMHLLHRAGVPCGIAYFDHQTRQGASAEDGRFVAEAAQALSLPFFLGGADVAALAKTSGESFEMAARRARYAFLLDTARDQGYNAIATGHHADDQAETVLLRLLRGSSPAGLAGIPPTRKERGIPIIRPLLEVARSEIRAWLASEKIAWREDTTNAKTDALRNRVRHELLPLLARDFNPGITSALNRLATLQSMDDALLVSLTTQAWQTCGDESGRIRRAAFHTLDPALQFRCLTERIRRAGAEADFETVSRAVAFINDGPAGKQIDLGNGIALFLSAEHAVFAPLTAPAHVDVIYLGLPGTAAAFGKRFEARGLDATPPIQAKLKQAGDHEAVRLLDIILHDEIEHVGLGDKWFRRLCAERDMEAEASYREILERFQAPLPQAPINIEARLAAGFTAEELTQLTAQRSPGDRPGAQPASRN